MRKLQNEELNRLSIDEFKKINKQPIVVVLDNIRSMHNIGSVFRTSDAFLIEKICLCGITASPPNKDIHKTALGSTDSVDWEYYKDTLVALKELRELNYDLIAIEQTEQSIPLPEYMPEIGKKIAIVLGHEVRGVSQDVVDYCGKSIELPQFGTKHSLNISVCAGIVLWELSRKLFTRPE